ncbi:MULTISPECIES: transcriptional regulator [unclassified Duganella]|uniref:helix-turn-helix transcriptional regulator n=1 Tax=unclassified Duganella TaxID=2636909 RepID=UPI000891D462|nr:MULTISPECIES: PAS domain-containing protein [unclassified Duganella]SDG70491.1 Predicted transcriptional regulator YheO, contains PAS and DNA-binding HTH domains [Duganella sp. OV458]SDJ96005.1 Predicted transcriptional regulator YheO, contains PAS and DNA-binding HTH domains [Duganella sp. OV510]
MKKTSEHQNLLAQMQHLADGLGKTLAPFCEVVLHDLTQPEHAILAIHNNLSGREVGAPATELGLARASDPAFEQVIANYPNTFPDGRLAKSTSIGIKDSEGKYVAALCLNVDLTVFRSLNTMLTQFGSVDAAAAVKETMAPPGADAIRQRIDQFAARIGSTPRALKADERKALMRELKECGLSDVRRAMDTVAAYLNVSRATVYNDAR